MRRLGFLMLFCFVTSIATSTICGLLGWNTFAQLGLNYAILLIGGEFFGFRMISDPYRKLKARIRRMRGIMPPPPTPVSAPLYAVRGWNLRPSGYLEGVKSVWYDNSMEAECRRHKHPDQKAPVFECSCGIYCYKNARSWKRGDWKSMDVWGIVELEGRVMQHSRGYKAEKAKIVAVCMNPKKKQRDLSSLGPDISVYNNFEAMCQEFGLQTD